MFLTVQERSQGSQTLPVIKAADEVVFSFFMLFVQSEVEKMELKLVLIAVSF